MNKNKNNYIYYKGDKEIFKNKLNVYILDMWLNKEITDIIKEKYNILNYLVENNTMALGESTYTKIAKVGNEEIYLNSKVHLKYVPAILFMLADVIIVGKVINVNLGLEIVDMALIKGKEVICISGKGGKLWYLSKHLIQDGATFI